MTPTNGGIDIAFPSTKSVTTSKFKENYLKAGSNRYKSPEHTEEEFDGKYSPDNSGTQTEKLSYNASR